MLNLNAQEMNKLFRERGLSLGSVESFTGGLFAKEITAVPGASKFYKGGLVTYATEEKVRLLGIPQDDVDRYGVVSKEIAYQMAKLGREKLNVDCCISFTGNAGPDAMENKPVGEIYIGLATPEKVEAFGYQQEGSRKEIQEVAIFLAFMLLEEYLKKC